MSKNFYSRNVNVAVEYFLARQNSEVIYWRHRRKGNWSPNGVVNFWWEVLPISVVAYSAKDRDIELSGGRIQPGDVSFLFLADVFTDLSGTTFISFSDGSVEFVKDEVITGETSGKSGEVVSYYVTAGDWDDGDAEGGLFLKKADGTFLKESLAGEDGVVAKSTGASEVLGIDTGLPNTGDEIVYRNIVYVVGNEGTGLITKEDITETTFTVWGRRKDG